MKAEIDIQLFDHLVGLAALELSPEEALYLRAQMNQQLQVIQELEAIPLEEDLLISTHGVKYSRENSPPLREDALETAKPRLDLAKVAPEVNDNYVVVPEIPHQKLG